MSVEVGQVYREKDKRFTRYVLVVQLRSDGRAKCGPCNKTGRRMFGGRISKIKLSNLEKRFELIEQEKEQ